ncbi:MAG: ATPase domain-containing protein [Candidatus Bathyarchaeia archaeon]
MEFPTGCSSLDSLLKGGYRRGTLNLVYGEAAAGKTTFALTLAFNNLERNSRLNAYYIDSDGKLSTDRMTQISKTEESLKRLRVRRPLSFSEQAEIIETLPQNLERDDLLVIDSITGLYRLETGDAPKTFRSNKELNRQLGYLKEISLKIGIAEVITGQVRSIFDDGDGIEPVAPRLLRFWSDTIIKLEDTSYPNIRQATLEKPSGGGACYIEIVNSGIEEVEEL